MPEINDVNSYNVQNENSANPLLGAHYSQNVKVEIPTKVVVKGPMTIPDIHLFNDFDANAKLSAINKDIFESTQKVAKPEKKKKFFGLF